MSDCMNCGFRTRAKMYNHDGFFLGYRLACTENKSMHTDNCESYENRHVCFVREMKKAEKEFKDIHFVCR